MQWPPMCAIELHVMAVNMYTMASYICDEHKYINGTNFQRLSMHAMTGRATRVWAVVVRYSHTKEICVHKGKLLSS